MTCHLIEQAKAKQLSAETVQAEVEWIETVCESDRFDVGIVECRTCGQVFAYCFKQYTSADGEDDCWSFWIPIDEQEVAIIRKAYPLLKFMGEMVHERPHICWHPDGRVFWADEGLPLAFVIFLP